MKLEDIFIDLVGDACKSVVGKGEFVSVSYSGHTGYYCNVTFSRFYSSGAYECVANCAVDWESQTVIEIDPILLAPKIGWKYGPKVFINVSDPSSTKKLGNALKACWETRQLDRITDRLGPLIDKPGMVNIYRREPSGSGR